jgi:hypothetical protein
MPTKFKVGDRVQVTANRADCADVVKGEAGTIIEAIAHTEKIASYKARMDNGRMWHFLEEPLTFDPIPTIAESFAQLVDRARTEMDAALTRATESGWDPFEHDPDPLPDLVIRYRKARHRHEFLKGVLADYEALVGEDK